MSWLIVGTVPDDDFPLIIDNAFLSEAELRIGSHVVSVARGTPALMATACLCAKTLGLPPPTVLLAGDTGSGRGSRLIYDYLVKDMDGRTDDLIAFHYLQPDVDWHNRILIKLQDLSHRPILLADAGYMYVAKMSGFAATYDIFTPDVGEMAFLADERAPHPFYTRGFLLQEEDEIPEFVKRAYDHENSAKYLLIKGRCDYVASEEGVLAKICEPCVETMEPIGGTGDSLTGILTALLAAGRPVPEAAAIAAKANRYLGLLSNPTPAFSIGDLLPALPEALKKALSDTES